MFSWYRNCLLWRRFINLNMTWNLWRLAADPRLIIVLTPDTLIALSSPNCYSIQHIPFSLKSAKHNGPSYWNPMSKTAIHRMWWSWSCIIFETCKRGGVLLKRSAWKAEMNAVGPASIILQRCIVWSKKQQGFHGEFRPKLWLHADFNAVQWLLMGGDTLQTGLRHFGDCRLLS